MRRRICTTLIFFLVAMALVSCSTGKGRNDIATEPVVRITEEVADESLPLPAGEAEKTADWQETKQTEPATARKAQATLETDEERTTEEDEHAEETTNIKEDTSACTLTVRCDTVFDNISKLDQEKLAILPRDGIIFPKTKVVFYAGESVFNLVTRELKKSGIHIDFVNTPMYNTVYIKGISNLYEQDCGELSGWVYMVNGKVPNYGCSQYILKDGDDIAFVYTCDLGKDVR